MQPHIQWEARLKSKGLFRPVHALRFQGLPVVHGTAKVDHGMVMRGIDNRGHCAALGCILQRCEQRAQYILCNNSIAIQQPNEVGTILKSHACYDIVTAGKAQILFLTQDCNPRIPRHFRLQGGPVGGNGTVVQHTDAGAGGVTKETENGTNTRDRAICGIPIQDADKRAGGMQK